MSAATLVEIQCWQCGRKASIDPNDVVYPHICECGEQLSFEALSKHMREVTSDHIADASRHVVYEIKSGAKPDEIKDAQMPADLNKLHNSMIELWKAYSQKRRQ